jgi:plasmid maintenance system antidote protein VapI
VQLSASTVDEARIGRLLPVGRGLIERAMAERGLTITALALRLGISRKHASNLLGGRAPMTDALAERIAAALGLGPAMLRVLRHDGVVPGPRRLRRDDGIRILGDVREPIEGWFGD